MIPTSAFVLIHPVSHGLSVEVLPDGMAGGAGHVANVSIVVGPGPVRYRNTEAAFVSIEQVFGEIFCSHFFEQVFAGLLAELHLRGKRGGEFHQFMIQQRRPELKAKSHAGNVRLD